jgi:dCMP deaminase
MNPSFNETIDAWHGKYRQPNEWSNVFLDMAFAIARRSKDPSTQCGAVLVDCNNVILSCGFNGPPPNIEDSQVPWDKRPDKYNFIIHAEENALLFALENHGHKVERSTLYVTHYPCSSCVLRLIRSKVGKVIIPDTPLTQKYMMNADGKEIEKVVSLLESQSFPKLYIEMVDYVRRTE